METAKDKTWMHYDDNGDGTCTVTLNVPELDIFDESVIVAMDFREIMGFSAQLPEEMMHDLFDKMTMVPSDLDHPDMPA